jgi:2-methylcitrate dehydratase PrpD
MAMELDRRTMILAAGLLPAATAAAQSPSSSNAPPAPAQATHTTDHLVRFATTLRYEDLPPEVVHAAKRLLLDTIGCAFAGWESTKGKLAAGLMQQLGGEPGALIIGTRRRVSATNAAFANAELVNALDFDAIPHLPPVVVPPLLAIADAEHKSGRDLILGIVIAYEIGARLSSGSSQMAAALLETNHTPEIFGINDEAIMASAAAIAAIKKMGPEQTAFAMGLGGYYCPPQSSHDWETGSPKSNVKYTPVGWVAQGAVTAALLAAAGFTANPIVLDGPAGVPRFYGWPKWRAERAVAGLGKDWRILNPDFKPYAACRYIHSRLDCMIAAVRKSGVKPEQIAHIVSLGPPFTANPDQMHVRTQEDAQFSIPYMLAIAAHGIPIDAHCQRAELLADPAIRGTMALIEWGTHPRTTETKRADPHSFIASAQITTRDGKRHFDEVLVPLGAGAVPDRRLSDDTLQAKFMGNARVRLTEATAKLLSDQLWHVDAVADVAGLTALMEA